MPCQTTPSPQVAFLQAAVQASVSTRLASSHCSLVARLGEAVAALRGGAGEGAHAGVAVVHAEVALLAHLLDAVAAGGGLADVGAAVVVDVVAVVAGLAGADEPVAAERVLAA
jgi:hypothetical protein